MSSRNSIDICNRWKKFVGHAKLPKLSCQLSGSKGREHSVNYIPLNVARIEILKVFKAGAKLHYAILFQLLVKGTPGYSESPRSFTLVTSRRFESIQNGYLLYFLQGQVGW